MQETAHFRPEYVVTKYQKLLWLSSGVSLFSNFVCYFYYNLPFFFFFFFFLIIIIIYELIVRSLTWEWSAAHYIYFTKTNKR